MESKGGMAVKRGGGEESRDTCERGGGGKKKIRSGNDWTEVNGQ